MAVLKKQLHRGESICIAKPPLKPGLSLEYSSQPESSMCCMEPYSGLLLLESLQAEFNKRIAATRMYLIFICDYLSLV